jgi:glycerophosphoryl diester phosphodiesterase
MTAVAPFPRRDGRSRLCGRDWLSRLPRPVVIAHRGASAHRPEHTLAAYELAIEHGADFIEQDLVATRDAVLVARHENEIADTTDVSEHEELAGRRTSKAIDGRELTGWFTEDLTLAEVRALRARERIPDVRPANAAYDGRFSVPTFAEVLELAARTGVGVYPETKHPAHFRALGLPLEEPLARALRAHPDVPVFLQSFDPDSLRRLAGLADAPRIQLLSSRQGPQDVSPAGLRAIAAYATGIGPAKDLVTPRLVEDAHEAGLLVHAWTFRPEDEPDELPRVLALGVDGVFADDPRVARRRLEEMQA